MKRQILLFPAWVMVLSSALAFAVDLTPAQQKLLNDARSHMGQAQTNLKLAQDAAAGNPSPAKSKLALTRVDSTRQSIEQVKARIAALPAEHVDVSSLQGKVDAATKAADDLYAQLTSGKEVKPQEKTTAPATAPPTPKQPQPAQSARLDYRQEEELKNARFNVTETEGLAKATAELANNVKSTPDPKSLDLQLIQKGINTIAKARERAGFAQDRLSKLPPDNAAVRETSDRLAASMASIAESEKVLAPVHATLSAIANPANYATLAADTARLRELAAMFANVNVFVEDREKAAVIVKEAPAASAEHDRLIKSYADLIRQQTPEGKQLESASRHFQDQLSRFTAALVEQKASLPGEIDEDLNKAQEAADKAVADKNPAYYSGAVTQQMGFVDEKLSLYEAIDAKGAVPVMDKVAKARQSLQQREEILKESIIAANELPPDRYQGADRDQLGKLATDAWLKVQPGAKILAIRIPLQNWKHEELWRFQTDSWYKIDRSRLQVQLVVGHDDKLAVVRPIDVWKNHLEGDAITAFPFHESASDTAPRDLLQRSKVR